MTLPQDDDSDLEGLDPETRARRLELRRELEATLANPRMKPDPQTPTPVAAANRLPPAYCSGQNRSPPPKRPRHSPKMKPWRQQ
jgi:hypothetical protein